MIFIGDKQFKSQIAAKLYAKNKIDNTKKGGYYPDDIFYDFLYDLLLNHEHVDRKVGCGVKYFNLNKNYGGTSHISIIRKDNSKDSFSWVKCSKQSFPKNNDGKITEAMRNSIAIYTYNFKKDYFKTHDMLKCELCLCSCDKFDNINYQTDHIYPFYLIKNKFIDTYVMPTEFDKHPVKKSSIFKEEDDLLEQEWVKYHNDNTSYRILCSKCNNRSWRE